MCEVTFQIYHERYCKENHREKSCKPRKAIECCVPSYQCGLGSRGIYGPGPRSLKRGLCPAMGRICIGFYDDDD